MYLDVRSKWAGEPDYILCLSKLHHFLCIDLYVQWTQVNPVSSFEMNILSKYITPTFPDVFQDVFAEVSTDVLTDVFTDVFRVFTDVFQPDEKASEVGSTWGGGSRGSGTTEKQRCMMVAILAMILNMKLLAIIFNVTNIPTSKIGSFSAMKFWTTSRMSDSSKESMSISFSLSNVLQLAPIPKRRRGRKYNLMFNFCSSHNFLTLFSHSQFSPQGSFKITLSDFTIMITIMVLMIPPS